MENVGEVHEQRIVIASRSISSETIMVNSHGSMLTLIFKYILIRHKKRIQKHTKQKNVQKVDILNSLYHRIPNKQRFPYLSLHHLRTAAGFEECHKDGRAHTGSCSNTHSGVTGPAKSRRKTSLSFEKPGFQTRCCTQQRLVGPKGHGYK